MGEESSSQFASTTMRQINQAWLNGRIDELTPMLHPDIVMVFPGFSKRIQGRERFLAGFSDFWQHARVLEYREDDYQMDVAGETAVITYRYDMDYERAGTRNRARGRDLWVFQKEANDWLAVWRTMLDLEEHPI